jgi:hypothetical protein
MTYRQFAYSKYWGILTKWHKKFKDYLFLAALYIPAQLSKSFYYRVQQKALEEWTAKKSDNNGSEMFLFYTRNSAS